MAWDKFEPVLRYTDLALYDVKHMDPVAHKELTGVSNELILDNLRKIMDETNNRSNHSASRLFRVRMIQTKTWTRLLGMRKR